MAGVPAGSPAVRQAQGVRVLLDQEISVHYGFMFLGSGDGEQPELGSARGGQANGLCGARAPGFLSLITGLHTGMVPLRIESLTEPPPDDGGQWEDVVEASLTTAGEPLWLSTFDDGVEVALPAGQWRARYSAAGMDAGRDADSRLDGDPVLDRYLLQLWPAPPAPDAVLRQSSSIAGYWHDVARTTPAPPPPPSAEQVAAAQAAQELALVEQQLAQARRYELWTWGGQAPTDELLAAGGRTAQLARQDRELVDALADLRPPVQRAVARWAARTACERAQLTGDARVVAALSALDSGDPLPPPFDTPARAWRAMFPGPATASFAATVTSTSTVTGLTEPVRALVLDPRAVAVDALLSAAAADPLLAAAGAVDAAANLSADRALFAEVRRTFGLAPASGPPRVPGPPLGF